MRSVFSCPFFKKTFFLFVFVCLLGASQADATSLAWNTFLGGSGQHLGYGITTDPQGNVYAAGLTNTTWNTGMFGSPVRAFGGAGYTDAVVAKLDPTGHVVWYTFLGVATGDSAMNVKADGYGNIYVTGYTTGTWGTPVHAYNGGDLDAFVVKLDSNGNIVWNTFLGGSSNDYPYGIELDAGGNIYVGGESYAAWHSSFNVIVGTNKSSSGYQGWLAKLDSSGNYLRHRWIGTTYAVYDVATDPSGNVYAVRQGLFYSGGWNYIANVWKMDANLNETWNVNLGEGEQDAFGIEVDSSGNIYVKGSSSKTWGTPIRAYSGGDDIYVAKLNSSGTLVWNTFLGQAGTDQARDYQQSGIALDDAGNIYTTGYSSATWGSPIIAHGGGSYDGFAAMLNNDGALQWNTFLGGTNYDTMIALAASPSGDVYTSGYTQQTSWGTPVNFPSCYYCQSVAKISNAATHIPAMVGMADKTQAPGSALTITGTCYDGDAGDTLNVSVSQTSGTSCGEISSSSASGSGGSVSLSAGCTIPESVAVNPLVFTFSCNDGTTTKTDTANVTANSLPTANAQSVSTNEDTALGITLTGSDPESSPLTYTIVTSPAHGALSGSGASRTFTPTANYNGADSFTFKVNDGLSDSTSATISITVNPVNDAPTATAQSQSTPEDTPRAITLSGTDPESSPLSYTIVTQPAHGALSGTPPSVTYTPTANYFGSDSFTFKVNDGTYDSSNATVTLTVTSVNDAPTMSALADFSVIEGATINLTGTCTDADTANTLTVTMSQTSGTSCGSISGTPDSGTGGSVAGAASCTAPNVSANEALVFRARCSDGTVNNDDPVTVTVNAAPTANAQSVTLDEDVATAITLVGTDPNSEVVSYTVLSTPSHGALSGTAPSLTYTPALQYYGADSFTFRVNDGLQNSNTATVSITVTSVNDAPVATAQSVSTDEEVAVEITLSGTDVESSPLTYAVVAQPTHGELTGTAPNLTYTPAEDYTGSDSFTFRVNDGTVNSSTATVSITVNGINDAPWAEPMNDYEEAEGAVLDLRGMCNDDDLGDTLTLTITQISGPSCGAIEGGSISGDGGFISIVEGTSCTAPNVNDDAELVFRVRCNDGTEIDDATFTITVNAAPTALPQSVSVDKNSSTTITLTGSDPSDEALTFTRLTLPSHGALTGTIPNYTYTPERGYHGTDSFTFRVSDGLQNSSVATINITVNNHNEPPVIEDEEDVVVECSEDCTLPDWTIEDPDGEPLEGDWVQVSGAGSSTLQFTDDGELDLSNNPQRGTYIVQYVVTDGVAETSSSPVTITVPNNPPAILDWNDIDIPNAELLETEFVFDAFVQQPFINAAFTDHDNDVLTYTWSSEFNDPNLIDFSNCQTGECLPIVRVAGTIILTVTTDDGYGGTGEQEIVLYIPPPTLTADDLNVEITESTYQNSSVVNVRGTLRSPVWPIIIFNDAVTAAANLDLTAASVARGRVDAETNLDTYAFYAEGVTLRNSESPLSVKIYTDVDGENVEIGAEEALIVQVDDGDDGNDEQDSASGLALGASWGCGLNTVAATQPSFSWIFFLVPLIVLIKKRLKEYLPT